MTQELHVKKQLPGFKGWTNCWLVTPKWWWEAIESPAKMLFIYIKFRNFATVPSWMWNFLCFFSLPAATWKPTEPSKKTLWVSQFGPVRPHETTEKESSRRLQSTDLQALYVPSEFDRDLVKLPDELRKVWIYQITHVFFTLCRGWYISVSDIFICLLHKVYVCLLHIYIYI